MVIQFRAVDKGIFKAVCQGKKTVETRANTPKYQQVAPGDVLTFVCGQESIDKTVDSVRTFTDIEELIEHISIAKINPEAKSAVELKKMYHSFPGYKDKIKTYGLVAWELTYGG